jgi:trimeric autotransporter adhesin
VAGATEANQTGEGVTKTAPMLVVSLCVTVACGGRSGGGGERPAWSFVTALDNRPDCAIFAAGADLRTDRLSSLMTLFRRQGDDNPVVVAQSQRSQLLQLQDAGVAFASSVILGIDTIQEPQDEIARRIHGVNELKQDGEGVEIAVVDVGAVWAGHPQFQRDGQSRVTRHTQSAEDEHATHVAGTLGSAGFASAPDDGPPVPAAYGRISTGEASKGIATAAKLRSYSATDCNYHIAVSASDISNFSIVKGTGWERIGAAKQLTWMGPLGAVSDPHFGRYDVIPQYIDRLVFERPVHLVVAAAGNDQDGDQSPPSGSTHRDSDGLQYPGDGPRHNHDPDNRNNGAKSVHSWCVGKNVLCVGSMEDPMNEGDIVPSSFANRGPTDDGRVKPDLIANGTTIMSLTPGPGRPFYVFGTGTSSAAPTAAGISALVLQEMRIQNVTPTAALLKAALIHSTRDDSTPGPNPKAGWGMARADVATQLVSSATVIESLTVSSEGPLQLCFTAGTSAQPKVTAVWTDPPGPLITTTADDTTSVLVNDIDLELVPPGSQIPLFPWVLSGDVASRGPNHVDNVEVITVQDTSANAGTWKLVLRPHRFGSGYTTQSVAVVVTGMRSRTAC